MKKKKNNTFDAIWKGLIEDLFVEFMHFFFPNADDIFDLTSYEFLDKELDEIYPEEPGENRRHVDKLVKLKLKCGGEQWLLLHIEVDGRGGIKFGARMFTYYYRIFDRYGQHITALAIFTGKQRKRNTPDRFVQEVLGTRLEYKYNTYRIVDQSDDDLKANLENPFAQIILAAKTGLLSGKLSDEELMTRHEWIFSALDKSLSVRKKLSVFAFIKKFVHFSDSENNAIFDKKLEGIINKKDNMGVIEVNIPSARRRGLVTTVG
ncbi:hypothetical protein GCM10027566_22130 [Arachidicoccus ginsenosidivorans]|jgi:hypothetical protein